MAKDYAKAKKVGEAAEDSFRDFHRWIKGFLVFTSCYLKTRRAEHANVLKYVFLKNELFLTNKGLRWREYD